MPFCENCGNKVSETAKFCPNCGEKVNLINERMDQVNLKHDEDSALIVSKKIVENNTPLEEDLSTYIVKKTELDFLIASKSSSDRKLKYGFINRNGQWMIQPQYDEIVEFNEILDDLGQYNTLYKDKYTTAKLNDKWGFINSKGEWVIQPIYDWCFAFMGRNYVDVRLNGKNGYINRRGQWLGEKGEYVEFDNEGYGLKKKDGKWGYVNRNEGWIIKPTFKKLNSFDDKNFALAKKKGKWGFIDRTGDWVIEPEFEDLLRFRLDYAEAQFSGKWGIIDRQAQWVVKPQFDYLYNISVARFKSLPIISNSVCHFHVKLSEKSGIIDNAGNWIVPLFNGDIEILYNDNKEYNSIKIDNKWGILALSGDWAIEPIFDERPQTYNETDKACVGSFNGKFGYLSSDRSWLIKPKYDSLGDFYDGVHITVFEEDGCFGLIDRNGKIIADAEFGAISSWDFKTNNFARANDLDYNEGLINNEGDWILEPEFDIIEDFDEKGMAKAKKGDKYGWINQHGWVIQPVFDDVWIDPSENNGSIRNSNESLIKPKDGAGIR